MLDKKAEAMLAVANTLTGKDLHILRAVAAMPAGAVSTQELDAADIEGTLVPEAEKAPSLTAILVSGVESLVSRGEYERQRTRESKVSTACLGQERQRHDWWPVGTELVGRIGPDTFTSVVVENPAVKSGRSVRITSGAAAGRICITPTRAAVEATEDYRQARNMGRGGGITNGWEFWQPAQP